MKYVKLDCCCNCSVMEFGFELHHILLQLLNVLCSIVTMTIAHMGPKKTRGIYLKQYV